MRFGITSQVLQVVAYGGSWCWEGQGSCHGLRGWWGILWGCRAWSDHSPCLQCAVRRSGFGLIKTWMIGLVGVIIFLFILYVLNVWLLQATSSRSGGCLVMKGSRTLFILLINYLSDLPLRMRRVLEICFLHSNCLHQSCFDDWCWPYSGWGFPYHYLLLMLSFLCCSELLDWTVPKALTKSAGKCAGRVDSIYELASEHTCGIKGTLEYCSLQHKISFEVKDRQIFWKLYKCLGMGRIWSSYTQVEKRHSHGQGWSSWEYLSLHSMLLCTEVGAAFLTSLLAANLFFSSKVRYCMTIICKWFNQWNLSVTSCFQNHSFCCCYWSYRHTKGGSGESREVLSWMSCFQ